MLSEFVERIRKDGNSGIRCRIHGFFAETLARNPLEWYDDPMDMNERTTAYILEQVRRYPALQIQDLFKFLHQGVMGCGHFVSDTAAELLKEELASLPSSDGPDLEWLSSNFCRIHLRMLAKTGLSPRTLFRMFVLSSQEACGSAGQLEHQLICLLALAREKQLPFSADQILRAAAQWGEDGYPACHHSPEFRAAYQPAYRVIHGKFIRWLPLLSAIDRVMAEKGRAVVAIEGGSASGKTTLATLLQEIYDCTVFHMDDFFLQPHQRTPERLAEAGGNVDRERFLQEVLLPLRQGSPVAYRRYDCHTQSMLPPTEIVPTGLAIVEGAYSMHPDLAEHYDLSVFLRITPELQRVRILMRNGSEMADRFFSAWIPMERQYFNETDAAGRCDLILEVDT